MYLQRMLSACRVVSGERISKGVYCREHRRFAAALYIVVVDRCCWVVLLVLVRGLTFLASACAFDGFLL